MAITEIKLAKQYKELFNPKWRHIAYYGGRAAGKSQATAYAILLRGRQSKIRVLATREFQNSITDSVHKLFKDLIDKHGFGDYEVLRDSIRNTNGTEIIFKGLRKDSQAIKSLEGVDICWTEEAQTITKDSIDTLIPTIRKPGSQLIWTFNRLTELDPVYTEICQNPTPDTYALKVNSDVLEAIGQLPQVLIDEREKMREREPELFPHVWLGEPISQVDNAIISRDKALNAMNRTIEPDGAIEIGVDVARFGADRSTFYKRKGLKIVGHQEYEKLSLTDLAERLESFVDFDKGVRIKVDDGGLGGGLTDIMKQRGYDIVPCNFGAAPSDKDKYNNLISEAWFYLQGIIDTIEIPNAPDLLMELTTRRWKMDSKGRRVVESKDDYKKRGYRSPDKADGLLLAFYSPEVPTIQFYDSLDRPSRSNDKIYWA